MRALVISLAASTILLIVAVVLASLVGTNSISLVRGLTDPSSVDHRILFDARLPAIVLAGLAGGGLAAVGVAFQAMLRNPLAEPYVLGVSGGAAFGATVAIIVGASWMGAWSAALVPASALVGGLFATALVYAIAGAGSAPSGTSILLAGVIVNAIAGALITTLKVLVSASKAQEVLFWLVGFIDTQSPLTLVVMTFCVAAGVGVLLADAGRMNLLSLGDESAAHLGLNVRSLERRLFLACSVVVGAIVSVTGMIGFVGLVVPHALRRLVGPDHRVLLPTSVVAGAGMLILCDMLSRASLQWFGTQLPVGAVTALVGGPLFLVLLRKRGVE